MEENERLAIIETKIESIKLDVHTLYKKTEEINSINTAIALLTSSINELKATVNALNNKLDSTNTKVENVSNEPVKEKAKNWTTITTIILSSSVTAIVGFVIAKIMGN